MRILIIGGTGFTGPRVARRLWNEGHEVVLFHRGQTPAELPPAIRHIYGERRDLPSFINDFKNLSPAVVLDMIAYTEEDARVLTRTFKRLARRVVCISSADVYGAYGRLLGMESGPPDPLPLKEDAPLRQALYPYRAHAAGPHDWTYDYEKILVERVVMGEPELPGTVLRLPAVYGPKDKQHRLFEYLKRMDDGRPFILLEEKKAGWRWTRGYVENVAAAIALAVTNEQAAGKIFNLGEPSALTEKAWVQSIALAASWDGEIILAPKSVLPGTMNADYTRHLATDTSRLRLELGYAEHVPLQQALRETIEWERAHPPPEVNGAQFDYAAEDEILKRLTERP
jgi:nucleoside-diphosphate-sugar epimerase